MRVNGRLLLIPTVAALASALVVAFGTDSPRGDSSPSVQVRSTPVGEPAEAINPTPASSIDAASESHPGTAAVDNVHAQGRYESVPEIVERIKRDVSVTGSILGSPGNESAYFRIEGLPDQEFSVGQQLMDGFIVVQISDHKVVLKNQVGPESFALYY